jgi:transcriptional regulator with XRE-family HTH domain
MKSIDPTQSKNTSSRKSANSLMAPEMLERIRALGKRIRQARINRKWRQADLVSRSGLSRSTIDAIERGSPTTSISSYFHVLWIMGLDRELDLIADPGLDREGLSLAFSVSEKRVRIPKKVNNEF